MAARYFVYDNISLKTMGYFICSFDSSSSSSSTDSQRNFNSIPIENGKYHPFITSTYDSPLIMNFQIAKDTCDGDEAEITVQEMQTLKRWLNRPLPHKLQISDEDFENIYWEGSFNVSQEVISGKRIGLTLTFTCNAPYGYKTCKPMLFKSSDGTFIINDISDEIGYIYPKIVITCNADGEFIMERSFQSDIKQVMKIENCKKGQEITILPSLQLTTNNSSHHDTLYNDFNFVFPKISNSFNDRKNYYKITGIDCTLLFSYKPIAKAVAL